MGADLGDWGIIGLVDWWHWERTGRMGLGAALNSACFSSLDSPLIALIFANSLGFLQIYLTADFGFQG
jgi:hypothetical protein